VHISFSFSPDRGDFSAATAMTGEFRHSLTNRFESTFEPEIVTHR
jgi:hypothetical protein